MKYVLDASVAIKWELTEPLSDKARRLRADFQQGIHELLAPDIFFPELTHALTRAERQGRITYGSATVLLSDALSTTPAIHLSLPLLFRACDLSSTFRIGVYDCLYVALAEREACELVTADDKLLRNLQSQFPLLRPLASFP